MDSSYIKKYFIKVSWKIVCFSIKFYFYINTRIAYYFFHQFRQSLNKISFPDRKPINNESETLAIFAIYQPKLLSPLIKRSIHYLYKNKIKVMLVAPHQFDKNDIPFLIENDCIVLTRANFGRDFGSYKYAALYLFRNPNLVAAFKKIILLNDSIIFPIKENDINIKKILTYDYNVVGLTENYEYNWHICSYFIVFKKNFFLNKKLQAFWKNYKPYSSRYHAIQKGELALGKKIKALTNSYAVIYNRENFLNAIKNVIQTNEFYQFISSHIRNKLLNNNLVLSDSCEDLSLLKKSFITQSPIHHFSLALIKYLDCFFLKRDICYRGLFSSKEVMQFIESVAEDETFLAALHLDFKNKGTVKSMPLLKKILGTAGAI